MSPSPRPARTSGPGASSYAPRLDGDADPGEVVWTQVGYEDRPQQSKDRPVLVVGQREDGQVLGLMLSSQRWRATCRGWMGLGVGTWDARQRPSWVRLDRPLCLDPTSIRREGAVLDRERFDRVVQALRARGWT